MTSRPSGAAARASSRPERTSWSVIAIAVRPRSAAALTTSDGERRPSDAVVWTWRSITYVGASDHTFGGRDLAAQAGVGAGGVVQGARQGFERRFGAVVIVFTSQ